MSSIDAPDGLAGCSGSGGYDDIGGGTSVVVYDQTDEVIATGYLDAGISGSGECVFDFSIDDVVGSASFYKVEISHRGKITVSAAEAKATSPAADDNGVIKHRKPANK